MSKNKSKSVTVKVLRGFYINGQKIMPKTVISPAKDNGGKAKESQNFVSLPAMLAAEMIAAGKAEETDEKANLKIKERQEDDGLDAAFGG